jgi:NADH dehydrogenase
MKIAITGANGHLGIRLVGRLLGKQNHQPDAEADVIAIVRSESARSKLIQRFPDLAVHVVRYSDPEALDLALRGCDVVVHLVGIIKESKNSSFYEAHEASCTALLSAAGANSIQRIVYMSINGTHVDSANRCLVSRANAENILRSGEIPIKIIKVPMVLGENDFASFALKKKASSTLAFTLRSGSMEQPIYAGDVINAIVGAIEKPAVSETVNLAGVESVTREQLTHRAAEVLGTSTRVVSLPVWVGFSIAWILEWLPNPPMSRAMLGVLDHDDVVDVTQGCAELGLTLTTLDETLKKVLL